MTRRGFFELGNHFFHGVSTNYVCTFCLIGEKIVNFGHCTIKCYHSKAMIIHIQYDILSHDSKANKGNISHLLSHVSLWAGP